MSIDCEPVVKIDIDDPRLRTAIQAAFPTSPPQEGLAYPAPGDIVLTISSTTRQSNEAPYKRADVCLTATWEDRFQHIPLKLASTDVCKTAATWTAQMAKSEARAALIAAVPAVARKIEANYRDVTTHLGNCTLSATSPVSQLTLELGETHIGPFAGATIKLGCLPKKNLLAIYHVHGQRHEPFEISPAMCEKGVELDSGGVELGSGGSGSGGRPPPTPPQPSPIGGGMMLIWFAVITSTVFLASILFVVLRNLFASKPINEGAARFLRIMISVFSAAFASALTGFLTVKVTNEPLGLAIDAGAGLAFAVIVYFFNPGSLGRAPMRRSR